VPVSAGTLVRRTGRLGSLCRQAADERGGDAGDILYARIVWYIYNFHFFNNIFTETKIEWPRVKRGFDALLKQYPDSLSALGTYARLACHSADWETARQLFERMGSRMDRSVFPKPEDFLHFRNDALPPPVTSKALSHLPVLVLSSVKS